MALINCTECGKQVSVEAQACPNCGHPVARMQAKLPVKTMTCPYCRKDVARLIADSCPHCNRRIVQFAPPELRKKVKKVMLCPDCGREVSTSAMNCPHCGRKLKQSAVGVMAVIIIIVLVLLFVGWFLAQLAAL